MCYGVGGILNGREEGSGSTDLSAPRMGPDSVSCHNKIPPASLKGCKDGLRLILCHLEGHEMKILEDAVSKRMWLYLPVERRGKRGGGMKEGGKQGRRQGVKEENEGRKNKQWPLQSQHDHFLLCTFLQRFRDYLCPFSHSPERPIRLSALTSSAGTDPWKFALRLWYVCTSLAARYSWAAAARLYHGSLAEILVRERPGHSFMCRDLFPEGFLWM